MLLMVAVVLKSGLILAITVGSALTRTAFIRQLGHSGCPPRFASAKLPHRLQ
jgi:hypothetical protein